MALVNEHFLKLPDNYLFADVAKKVNAFKVSHPNANVVSLGIGDVTQPLCSAVTEAMHRAVDEMTTPEGFHGYGPEQGYPFLRETIIKHDFLPRGIHLDPSEIFVNDGAKSDTGNIQELVRWDNSIGVTDPIYPVYIDSNVMIGRAGEIKDGRWSNVIYMPCTAENHFIPQLPNHRVDIIYLCYPNNPTGAIMNRRDLEAIADVLRERDILVISDEIYSELTYEGTHHSIAAIEGMKERTIFLHGFSKAFAMTGFRIGYACAPRELIEGMMKAHQYALMCAPIVSQEAAIEALVNGKSSMEKMRDQYHRRRDFIVGRFNEMGLKCHLPKGTFYAFPKVPESAGMNSMEFAKYILEKAKVAVVPGSAFGESGEGFLRASFSTSYDNLVKAADRIEAALSGIK